MSGKKSVPILAGLFAAAWLLVGCAPDAGGPQPVGKSLYLNKKFLRFVMDNGPSYREIHLANGKTIHYWRSDTGKILAEALGWDEDTPDTCELVLETDKSGVVRHISIIEDSMSCNEVLK